MRSNRLSRAVPDWEPTIIVTFVSIALKELGGKPYQTSRNQQNYAGSPRKDDEQQMARGGHEAEDEHHPGRYQQETDYLAG